MQKTITTIEITVKSEADLYSDCNIINTSRKMLKESLEEHIFNIMKNHNINENIKLKVIIASKLGQDDCDLMKESIKKHFSYKEKETRLDLKQALKHWGINMLIGVLFLVLCLILVEVLEPFTYIKTLKIVKEGLLIVSWVALWEPITFILFNRRAMRRDINYYKKLSTIPIEITCDK